MSFNNSALAAVHKINTSDVEKQDRLIIHLGYLVCSLIGGILLIPLCLVGNSILIYLVFKNKELRTFFNYLVVNKSISDIFLLASLASNFQAVYWAFFESPTLRENFQHLLRSLFYSQYYLFLYSSSLSLMCITVDRFLAVLFPFKRATCFRNPRITISAIWLLSSTSIFPHLPFFITASNGNDLDNVYVELAVLYIFPLCYILFYCIPLLLMAVCYTFIVYTLWVRKPVGEDVPGNHVTSINGHVNKACKLTDLEKTTQEINDLHIIETSLHRCAPQAAQTTKRDQSFKKVMKMLMIVVLVYGLSWTGYVVFKLVILIQGRRFTSDLIKTKYVFFLITFVDGSITPYLYFTMSSQYKKALKKFLGLNDCSSVNKVKLFPTSSSLAKTGENKDNTGNVSMLSQN